MANKIWTPEKLEFIRKNLHLADKGLAAHFGVTVSAVKTARLRNNILICENKHASPEEDAIIIELYPHTKSVLIAEKLNRPLGFVYNRAVRLGVKKSKEFLASPESGIFYPEHKKGINTRFKIGHVPANKGKTLSPETREKVKHTWFTKGHKPHNTKHDKCISIRHNHPQRGESTYKWIRISENNWELYHRYLWKQEHGSIPKGFNVVFKDGNAMNCVIENLELISNKELGNRNRDSIYPEELRKTIRLNNKLKKQLYDKK